MINTVSINNNLKVTTFSESLFETISNGESPQVVLGQPYCKQLVDGRLYHMIGHIMFSEALYPTDQVVLPSTPNVPNVCKYMDYVPPNIVNTWLTMQSNSFSSF